MHLLSCSIRTFHLGMSGETNSSTLFISRTRSKFCNLQIKRLQQLLFCSTSGYHTLISRGHVEFHGLIDEEILLHVSTHLYLQFSCLRMLGVYWGVYQILIAIHVALKNLRNICILLSSIGSMGSTWSWPCYQVCSLQMHILGQRVRFSRSSLDHLVLPWKVRLFPSS